VRRRRLPDRSVLPEVDCKITAFFGRHLLP
jgi:hypothetical protein